MRISFPRSRKTVRPRHFLTHPPASNESNHFGHRRISFSRHHPALCVPVPSIPVSTDTVPRSHNGLNAQLVNLIIEAAIG